MRTFDFAPLSRSSIGFDRVFDLLNNAQMLENSGYPPYDIVRTGEDSYRIAIALARVQPGRDRGYLAAKSANGEGAEIRRGRSITSFIEEYPRALSPAALISKITSKSKRPITKMAFFEIDLVRRIPEAMKPRRIDISSSSPKKSLAA